MINVSCGACETSITRRYMSPSGRHLCNLACKAAWQRTQHPVSNEWLRQKYEQEKLSANTIAKMVGRDPKGVWTWLRNAGIQTRKRGEDPASRRFKKGEPSLFKGHKHTEENKERQRARRLADGHVPYLKNGKHYLKGKRGPEVHSWKGGLTPERQAFYASDARCNLDHRTLTLDQRGSFHVHHIISFMVRELRSEPSNLILLCGPCHRWVHGKGDLQ